MCCCETSCGENVVGRLLVVSMLRVVGRLLVVSMLCVGRSLVVSMLLAVGIVVSVFYVVWEIS